MKSIRILGAAVLIVCTASLTVAFNQPDSATGSSLAPAPQAVRPIASNPFSSPTIPNPSPPVCEDLDFTCWSNAALNYQNKVADIWGVAAAAWTKAMADNASAYAAAQAAFEQCESTAIQNGASTEPCYDALAAATAQAAVTLSMELTNIDTNFNQALARQLGVYQTAAQACCDRARRQ